MCKEVFMLTDFYIKPFRYFNDHLMDLIFSISHNGGCEKLRAILMRNCTAIFSIKYPSSSGK